MITIGFRGDPTPRHHQALRPLLEGIHTIPGLRIIRFDAPIFFANVGILGDAADDLIHDEGTQAVVLDVSAGDDMDTTTSAAVKRLLERADEVGVRVVFARMHETVRTDLEAAELDLSGRVYPRVEDAVEAYGRGELRGSPGGRPPE